MMTNQTHKRRRIKFEFWMDANKTEQARLGDRLWQLKQNRKFAPTLRNAVRLFFSLMDGDTSVLREMFPHLVAQIESDAQTESYEVAQLTHLIASLHDRLDSVPATGRTPHEPLTNNLPGLAELEELTVGSMFTEEISQVDPTEVRANFSSGMGNLFDDDDDDLWS